MLTLFVGMPRELWDILWLVYPDSGEAVREAFLVIYQLEIATIVVDEVEVEVVRPVDGGLSLWVSWSLFVVTPAAACLAGCGQSRVP